MDMMENDDKLVKAFFDAHRSQPLPDDGFTRRVMNSLPEARAVWLNRLFTAICVVAAAAMLVCANGFALLRRCVLNMYGELVGAFTSMQFGPHPSVTLVIASVGVFSLLAIYHIFSSEEYGI